MNPHPPPFEFQKTKCGPPRQSEVRIHARRRTSTFNKGIKPQCRSTSSFKAIKAPCRSKRLRRHAAGASAGGGRRRQETRQRGRPAARLLLDKAIKAEWRRSLRLYAAGASAGGASAGAACAPACGPGPADTTHIAGRTTRVAIL
jgi:hypothetical protein